MTSGEKGYVGSLLLRRDSTTHHLLSIRRLPRHPFSTAWCGLLTPIVETTTLRMLATPLPSAIR
jgi:hypothetical protein